MPNKKSRKNPVPLVGSVIANPALFTKRLKGGEKVYFNVGQGAKVERSQTKPQYIIVTAPQDQPKAPRVPRPPRPRPTPVPPPPVQPPQPAPPPPPPPRRAPQVQAQGKHPKHQKKNRRAKPPIVKARPTFPPFTRPSEQTRQNPLFGGRENPVGDIAKTVGEALMVFVALGLGIPLVKRAIMNVLQKPEIGPDGKPTILSHAIQAGLATVAFGVAEKAVKDPTLKTLVQGAAVVTAVAPAVNQLIDKVKPGSGLKLLGDPTETAPIRLNFNVDPLPLTEGLAADLQDLDTNPAIDRLLSEKSLGMPTGGAPALGSPQVAPAGEPLFRGLGSPQVAPEGEPLFRGILGSPQVAPEGEPLFRGFGDDEKLIDVGDVDPLGPITPDEPLRLGALYIN